MSVKRVAYLTGEYPAISHTFILREVEALRQLGLDVLTCSVRQTGPEHHRGPAEKAAAENTFYVIKAAKNSRGFFSAQLWALRRPKQYWAALKLAWQLRQPGLRGALYQLFYLVEAVILAQHLNKQGITHLHNHFANSSCSVAILTHTLSEIPFSFTLHGPSIFFEPRLWRIDEKIAQASYVACISHFCRSQGMIFADPAHWHKLKIVHCGVQPETYVLKAPRAPGKRVVFVGRLAAVKGVLVLLRAFSRVLKTHPDAHLTLVGDGPERARIEALASELGCSEQVRFAGYLSQQEVAQELQKANLFALPSFAEGVPVVLMEAMASELAVVATRIAGIPELVEDGKTGFTVPAGDEDAFAQALQDAFDAPETCAQMGVSGREVVTSDFHVLHEAMRMKALICDGPQGPEPRSARAPQTDESVSA